MVADALSRIPGSELLTSHELLSNDCTLNVMHVQDLPLHMCTTVPGVGSTKSCNAMFLNGIICINER